MVIEILNIYGGIIGLIALILACPISIIANILSPRIIDWYSQRSKDSIKKNIKRIESDIFVVGVFINQPSLLISRLFRQLGIIILYILAIIINNISLLNSPKKDLLLAIVLVILITSYIFLFYQLSDFFSLTKKILAFEIWKKEMNDRITKLQTKL